ncbi:hypothetical protein SMD11_4573 [Streptomyces albireticuli]|uniref:Uncharacterized protein n=1 Tax=Streptomyces albireticuli TaxID=1940 RepID=A0A1Z2L7B1_9ACTN|nr:hypothetical protein SMD11_4573 [Streptomyces albireticuli]
MSSASPYPASSPSPAFDAADAVRHLLVLPDRDAADEVAEEAGQRFPLEETPQIVREALAGEDDAEDAQWLVVVEDPRGTLDPEALRELAEEYEGWLESE